MLIKHNLKDRDSKLTFKADAQVSLAVRILCRILWLVGLTITKNLSRLRALGLATIRVLSIFLYLNLSASTSP